VTGGEGLDAAVADLAVLAARLRRDCAWDRAQTPRTIVPHTIEEAYEVADAALAGDDGKLLDELGDLLFQTVFLALLLEERGHGDLAEVARRIHTKLVRRHPHVFETPGELHTPGDVKDRWEVLKAQQEQREGIFHDVPDTLPALLAARKVQRRAATAGFDFDHAAHALTDVESELAELRGELRPQAPETEPDARAAAELGDLLFACVNVSRHLNVDPELALRQATGRFVARVERAAELAAAEGRDWVALSVDDQDRYFDLAKELE
jgi:nucleoside triphosphate diphosphatase